MAKRNSRATDGYTERQKQMVVERYPYCVTRAEKIELMQELGMRNLEQLYNLANRLGATRKKAMDPTERLSTKAFDPSRRLEREDPRGVEWTDEDDEYLRARFGKIQIEEISYHRRHTETATLYRARLLGLRFYCKYWALDSVLDWLSQTRENLFILGMDIYPCYNRQGKLAMELVSTSSLLRLIADEATLAILEGNGADKYFLKELADLMHEHGVDEVIWEPSRWVSHGHICLNPWAGESFGLIDNGADNKMRGRELYPWDLGQQSPGGSRWDGNVPATHAR